MAAAVARPPPTSSAPIPSVRPAPLPSTPSTSSEPQESSDPGVDVGVLKELARTGLVEALNAVPGAKTLVLDPTLAGPLGLITEVSLLKQHGIDKMFWLEPGALSASTQNVVYLCRPQIRWMKIIAEQIKHHTSLSERHTYNLLLVPRRTVLCDRILEEEGVFGDLHISALKLEFIPLEEDVLSLELEGTYKEIFLDDDHTSLYYSAQALMTIQQAFGLFPRILGKGTASARLCSLLQRMRTAGLAEDPTSPALSLPSTVVDSLVIIDRATDMITPLCTQLTYQGLIDELIGIKNSYVEVDASLLSTGPQAASQSATTPSLGANPTAPQQKKKKHLLAASSDPVFSQLRDLNFAIVGSNLNRLAKRLNEDYEGRHKAQTVEQLRDFVGRLGGLQTEHQALRLHTGLSEQIVPMTQTEVFNKSLEIQQNLIAGYDVNAQFLAIEDLINRSAPLHVALRLLCLFSITVGGIKAKALESMKREILQSYGYEHLTLLLHLEKLGLLCKAPGPHVSLPALRKHLRLLVDDVSEQTPTDIAYVYSGYAPLSIRLIQCVTMKPAVVAAEMGEKALAPAGLESKEGKIPGVLPRAHAIVGWKGFEEIVRQVPGDTVDVVQKPEGDGTGKVDLLPKGHSTTTVVFFLGGCTYTEIAALRWMSRQARGRRYLICTTSIVNGSTLIDSLSAGAWKHISA
ncbi:ATP binding protein [Dacryopinax primogenitus]|uniref:ATP binding protein n=1 Tax=Dacryopinax primogenitus (strain DJM 731) TaxID=1858805 RepID=M5G210_DACPD|nr:ATP binding protein [Dacryopinax primogenitus]EJU02729.1 ATP binding protein [Dacryopinax primogenitus]